MNNEQCVVCKNKRLEKRQADIDPFLIDRMFDKKDVSTEFYICPNCEIAYFSIRPNDEEMERYYQNYMKDEYVLHRDRYAPGFAKWHNDYMENSFAQEVQSRKANMKAVISKYMDIKSIQNILDFGGCEENFFIDELNHVDRYVYNIDKSNSDSATLKKEEILSRNWDLVMCSYVLEHVSDPVSVIDEIASIMKEGYLYIELPYDDYWNEKIKKDYTIKELLKRPKLLKEFFKKDKYKKLLMSEHINAFRNKTLEVIFKNRPEFTILENGIFNDITTFGNSKSLYCLVKKNGQL